MKTFLSIVSVFPRESQGEPVVFPATGKTAEHAWRNASAKLVAWLRESWAGEDDNETGLCALYDNMTPTELESWFMIWQAYYTTSVYSEEIELDC